MRGKTGRRIPNLWSVEKNKKKMFPVIFCHFFLFEHKYAQSSEFRLACKSLYAITTPSHCNINVISSPNWKNESITIFRRFSVAIFTNFPRFLREFVFRILSEMSRRHLVQFQPGGQPGLKTLHVISP